MAESIQLGIVVDTDTRATRKEFSDLRREVKREAEGMGDDWEAAAQKVEDSLREAGARDDLIEAARRIGQDGPSEIEKMQRSLRDLDDTARESAQNVSQAFEDNALTADDVFKADLAAELASNAVEAGAEIIRGLKDGFDAEDAGTLIDGLTDTIFALGAVGGPLGIAGAALAGGILQGMTAPLTAGAEEQAARFEETFTAAFENIIAAGEQAGRELTIQNAVNAIIQDVERLNEVTAIANELGASRGQVLRAMAGDTEALSIVEAAAAETVRDATDARDEAMRAADGSIEATNRLTDAQGALSDAEATTSDALRTVTGDYTTNVDAVNAASDAVNAKADADRIAANRTIELEQALADSTGKAREFEVTIGGVTRTIKAMPGKKEVEVTDDGSAKKTQGKIDDLHGKSLIIPVDVDSSNVDAYVRGLSYSRPVLNVDVRYRRVGGPTP